MSAPTAPLVVPAGAPWLAAWRAAFADDARSRLAQVATVAGSGEPEVRNVVLRGLSADGAPYFAADRRSAKVRSVRAGSLAELCLWWPDPGTQVRLRGPVSVIGGGEAGWSEVRRDVWGALRGTERDGFTGPAPGTPLPVAGAAERAAGVRDAASAATAPHPNFTLLVLTPLRFDRLVLGEPHARTVYTWSGTGWNGGAVAP